MKFLIAFRRYFYSGRVYPVKVRILLEIREIGCCGFVGERNV